MKRMIGVLLLFILGGVFMCAGYSEKMITSISESGIVRLHILANSNSEEDQNLKLKVRDSLINADIFKEKEPDLNEINEMVNKIIKENGKNYSVKSERGRFYFPTKKYEKISLPAGEYEALRVVLGEGEGENWWCVMYPPLCFGKNARGEMSDENEEKLKEMLTEESYNLISDDEIRFVPAFKTVEIWQELKEKFKKGV